MESPLAEQHADSTGIILADRYGDSSGIESLGLLDHFLKPGRGLKTAPLRICFRTDDDLVPRNTDAVTSTCRSNPCLTLFN